MIKNKEHLTVLNEAEHAAFYEIPDFDETQRYEYLTLTTQELEVATNRRSLSNQVFCCIQIGYFKAVNLFFGKDWATINKDDADFIAQQYFNNCTLGTQEITKHEYYTQCNAIMQIFGYVPWSVDHEQLLFSKATELITHNINPQFIALELLGYLRANKIVRPKYTTLQTIISNAINYERSRIASLINNHLDSDTKVLIDGLLINETTLSNLAAIKQDAKDFKPRMMQAERNKLKTMEPIYKITVVIFPLLALSKSNIAHYASLIHYYSIHELRDRIKPEQTYLYILCYIWQRYRQINDNLINALGYHQNQMEVRVKQLKSEAIMAYAISQKSELIILKRLAQLYIDDNIPDNSQFGEVRKKAFNIIAKDILKNKVNNSNNSQDVALYWQSVDKLKTYLKSNIRNIATTLAFSSIHKDNMLLDALKWIQNVKHKPKLLDDYPEKSIPNNLLMHLTTKNSENDSMVLLHRYEFFIYKKLDDAIRCGNIFLENSLQYNSLSSDLVPMDKKDEIIRQIDSPVLKKSLSQQLDELLDENDRLWTKFDKKLRQGKLKHLYYDEKTKTLHLKKSALNKQEQIDHGCYDKLPFNDIVNVIKTVHKKCEFLSALTHIQPRYAKSKANIDYLIAVIIAQAMNNGNLKMADIANIPYATLQDTFNSRVRLATLREANNILSNDIAQMPIFTHYSFDPELLYGAVDGQKFEAETPTIKTRYSKKYFRKGKGVVAYTLLCNHIPLQAELIGANEHESYFAFDIWYNNDTEILPQILTGDMHIVNRANSAIMYWFNGKLYPRFTNIEAQRQHLYCGKWSEKYNNFIIKPTGEIKRNLIESQSDNLERIIATLGSRNITQSSLIRKLCNYKQEHQTRQALFEFDKIVRSNHTLRYLLDPNIITVTQRSQNRLEAYHQLRSSIAQAYGKKQLIGKTDLALEISNQCGRLLANIIIHFNSMILSKLYERYTAENNQKGLNLLKKVSPVAWQHIHFQGHLIFNESGEIDLDDIVSKINLV